MEERMRPISVEKRELIVAAKERGEKEAAIAAWLGVSLRSVAAIWKLYRSKGGVAPEKYRGRPPRLTAEDEERVAAEVARAPDATLDELAARLSLPIGRTQLHRLLRKLGFQRKKGRSARISARRERSGTRPRKR
jgi:transposase